MRGLYENQLIIEEGGHYTFAPVLNNLRRHSFSRSDFSADENGFLVYTGNDEGIRLERGIHVTEENGWIDWGRAVSEGNVDFAMIRIGTRQETSEFTQEEMEITGRTTAQELAGDSDGQETTVSVDGQATAGSAAVDSEGGSSDTGAVADDGIVMIPDAYFETNMYGATAAGLYVGAYYELAATSAVQAESEAAYVIGCLEPFRDYIRYPVAVYIQTPEKDSPLAVISRTVWTTNVLAFCRKIEQAGYVPLIFGDITGLVVRTDPSRLDSYGKWLIDESRDLYFPYEFKMWQYATTSNMPGIEGSTALDVMIARESGKNP